MHETPFVKFEALGNDFIIFIDPTPEEEQKIKAKAPSLCNRHLGIGSDGLILLNKIDNQWIMKVINQDGSWAQNCGNGLRCAFLLTMDLDSKAEQEIFFNDFLYTAKRTALTDSLCHPGEGRGPDWMPASAGMTGIDATGNRCNGDLINVFMGDALVRKGDFNIDNPIKDTIKNIFWISVGNEHLVFLLKERPKDIINIKNEIAKEFGDMIKDFNLGLSWSDDAGQLFSEVFERGVGFTKGCGTGAMAALASWASIDARYLGKSVTINQPGGSLIVEAQKTDSDDYLLLTQTGPASRVFSGSIVL